jgi:hypothetical protein
VEYENMPTDEEDPMLARGDAYGEAYHQVNISSITKQPEEGQGRTSKEPFLDEEKDSCADMGRPTYESEALKSA